MMGRVWVDGDEVPLRKWPRLLRRSRTVEAMQILPPSGDPVFLSVEIVVSGPGVEEARESLVGDSVDQIVAEIEESFSRACGFVPVDGSTVAIRFEP